MASEGLPDGLYKVKQDQGGHYVLVNTNKTFYFYKPVNYAYCTIVDDVAGELIYTRYCPYMQIEHGFEPLMVEDAALLKGLIEASSPDHRNRNSYKAILHYVDKLLQSET